MMQHQLELQCSSFGVNPTELVDEKRDEFIRWNVIALTDELHEALNEVKWKPWAEGHGFVDRDAYVKELIDAWHFLMNLLLAANVSAEEFNDRYFAKARVNADRQAAGYDSQSTKCDNCGRALDEPETV
jgi:dimeric dUTPase (all-alpha-NTP-PPase superfamily)